MKYSLNKKGFTLVELMVVIAIIGILTAIVTANFAQSKAKARDAKRISDLAQIQLTLEMAFDRCNIYPASISVASFGTEICTGLPLSNFISKVPTDNGVDYVYGVNSDNSNYILKADLETNSSALVDAYSTDNVAASYKVNGTPTAIHCSGRPYVPTQKYEYCVTPK